ncbi:hypothetical protein BBJ29_008451 [Phytophthora kernoviae]|uniref:Jacalin-type lectin domain-containing protein n=1 Tax=Phytophthora kernoviae TaxID=325452 RepID=A0A421FKC1_9STRA|nr:hypothetical protein BBJ29_008451 [Phytophthora kernoviae]
MHCLTSASAFDWTFWNDDDNSEGASSTGTPATSESNAVTNGVFNLTGKTLSPELKKIAPSLFDSEEGSASASKKTAPVTPTASSGSVDTTTSGASDIDTSASGSFIDPSSDSFSGLVLANPTDAKSTIVSTYRNWVGPQSVAPDSACYREAHIMKTCPSNFNRHKLTGTCWTECPLEYPIECGLECIRQSDDCGMEVFWKTTAVVSTAMAGAAVALALELVKGARWIRTVLECGLMMIGVVRAIIRYVRGIKITDPTATRDRILNLVYQSNNVVTDLPMAIYMCKGIDVPQWLDVSGRVLVTFQWILINVIAYDDQIVSGWDRFKAFLKGANFTEAAESINDTEIATLKDALKSNSTCGYDMRALTDRAWLTVGQYRKDNPSITEDELRIKMSESQLVMTDIATVTNNCMDQLISESNEATAYKTRDSLRKSYAVIINELITTGKSNNATSMKRNEMIYKTFDRVFISVAVTGFDLTGLTGLFAEYLQTICGPTQFIGDIDDGTDKATLGMNIVQDAFNGSTMSWTKKGDGAVVINFTSKDTKDVTVNIMSGGTKIGEVDIKKGGTSQWTSTVKALAGKTLYLDRWRPGFLGLPGTGGGSLLIWIPHASEGGHLDLAAQLNVS